jgi:hypothetical protein
LPVDRDRPVTARALTWHGCEPQVPAELATRMAGCCPMGTLTCGFQLGFNGLLIVRCGFQLGFNGSL